MKKQNKNRIIAAVLALGLCLTASPAQPGIQGYAYSTEMLTVSNEAYGELDYYNHGDCIHDVTLPASVVYVGNKAFYSCFGLHSVTVMNPECSFGWEYAGIFGSDYTPVYFVSYFPGTLKGYACSTLHDYALWNNETFEPFVHHDLNADGAVNTLDIILLQKYLLNAQPFSKTQFLEADLNRDGDTDVLDLALMKRKVIGQ